MLIHRNDLKNIAVLVIAEGTSRCLSMVLTIMMARELGLSDFGHYCTALSFVMIFSVAIDFGLATLTFRDMSRNPFQSERLLSHGLIIEVIASFLISLLVFGFVFVFRFPATTKIAIMILWIWTVFFRISGYLRVIFKAKSRMEFDAFINIFDTGSKLILVVIAFRLGSGLFGVLLMIVVGGILTLICTVYLVNHHFVLFRGSLELDFIKHLVKSALPFALSIICTTCLYRVDTIFLSFFHGEQDVGLYNASYRLVLALFFIPFLACQAFFPRLTYYAGLPNQSHLSRLLAYLFKYMLLLIYPTAIIVYLLAPTFISLLYTPEYAQSSTILRVLIWVYLLNALNYVALHALNALGREKEVSRFLLAGLVINVGINSVLVPSYSFYGAALAILLSQAFILLMFLNDLMRIFHTDYTFRFSTFTRFFILLTFPFMMGKWGSAIGWHWSINLTVFILLYFLLIITLKIITYEDFISFRLILFAKGPETI